jgi:peptidoglycan/xylan/chitin deacetylase (PgdA/CDA1 family)
MLCAAKRAAVYCLARCGSFALLRFFRTAVFRFPCIGIVCYHHVGDGPDLVSPYATPAAEFGRHVDGLRRRFFVTGTAFIRAVINGKEKLRGDAIVFTFDDGYRDNARNAAPVLERAGVRGTFYVTGQSLTNNAFLWNDRCAMALERLREHRGGPEPTGLPPALSVLVKAFLESRKKTVFRAARDVFDWFYGLPQDERERELSRFPSPAIVPGVGGPRVLMDASEVEALGRAGHEIGAHTVTHSRLSMSGAAQEKEVALSVTGLRALGIPVDTFAYPFGYSRDFDECSVALLKRAGIETAMTAYQGVVAFGCDPLRLPRIPVASWHTVEFIIARFELFSWKLMAERALGRVKVMIRRRKEPHTAYAVSARKAP